MPTWRISAWTHPEDVGGYKLKEHSIPAIRFTCTDPEEPRGRCTITVPETYDWPNLISVQNPALATDTSQIRLYAEGVDNTGDPDIEWKLVRFKKRITDDGLAVVDLYGIDWRVAGLDAAVVRWHDWEDGATKTRDADWKYGGTNLMGDGWEEDVGTVPKIWELWNDATGGTFTLSDGTDTTINTNFDATGATIELRLEGFAAIADMTVSDAAGDEDDPWVLEHVDPFTGVDLTVDDTLLTGGTSTLTEIQKPRRTPDPWTKSKQVSTGVEKLFGRYDLFLVSSLQAHTGNWSLKIDPGPIDNETERYPGAQRIMRVVPGTTYQAEIWVYPTSATDKWRFVVRDLYGKFIDSQVGGIGFSTFTANTWTLVTITDIDIPLGTEEVIVRFSNVNAVADADPSIWFLDDPVFFQGMTPATIGVQAIELLADAQVDHPTVDRIPYINQGAFTAADDSGGNTWTRAESNILRRGMHYASQVAGGIWADLGYEYDLTPNGATAVWDWEIWNEGGRGATLTGVAFHVGLGIAGGLIAGRDLAATRWLAEGADGIITEAINALQETKSGITEKFFGDPDITDTVTLLGKAQHKLDDDIANRVALTAELDDSAPSPYADFGVGDTVEFAYAGTMDKNDRRISEIALRAEMGRGGELHWTPSVTASRLFEGQGAITEGLYGLLSEYRRLPESTTLAPLSEATASGGMATVMIAATNSSEKDIINADVQATGTNDELAFDEAKALLPATGGEIVVAEGSYAFGAGNVDFGATPVTVRGLGHPVITVGAGGAFTSNEDALYDGLEFTGGASGAAVLRNVSGPGLFIVRNCIFKDMTIRAAVRIYHSGSGEHFFLVEGCVFDTITLAGGGGASPNGIIWGDDASAQARRGLVTGNLFDTITGAILDTNGGREIIATGNVLVSSTGKREGSWVHNWVNGTFEAGDHPDPPKTIPQLAAFSRSGELVVTPGEHRFYFPFAATLINARAAVGTAPTGSAIIVDININTTSAFTSKPTIADGANVSSLETATTTAIAAGDYLAVDIDQIGSTTPGDDLTVVVEWSIDV